MKSVYYSVAGKPLSGRDKPPAAAKRPKVVRWLREMTTAELQGLLGWTEPEQLRRALLRLAIR